MEFKHVEGEDRGKVVLYAISTCLWCKKTKRLLNDLGVAYQYIDVDMLDDDERDEVKKEILKWKDRVSYPLIVINDKTCIPFFDEDDIKQELNFD